MSAGWTRTINRRWNPPRSGAVVHRAALTLNFEPREDPAHHPAKGAAKRRYPGGLDSIYRGDRRWIDGDWNCLYGRPRGPRSGCGRGIDRGFRAVSSTHEEDCPARRRFRFAETGGCSRLVAARSLGERDRRSLALR